MLSFVISMLTFAALVYAQFPVTILYDRFLAFLTSSLAFSAALSLCVYLKALGAPNHALAQGGNSGKTHRHAHPAGRSGRLPPNPPHPPHSHRSQAATFLHSGKSIRLFAVPKKK